jgi:hypothetical protein
MRTMNRARIVATQLRVGRGAIAGILFAAGLGSLVHCGTSGDGGITADSGGGLEGGSSSGSASSSGSGSTSGSGSSSGSGVDAGGDVDAAPDAPGSEAGCRSSNDCPPFAAGGCGTGAYCQGPEEGPCIGVALRIQSCSADIDCADAEAPGGFRPTVCRRSNDFPMDPKGCWPPCAADSYCPAEQQCEVDSGHCVARPCSACPAYFDCNGGTCSVRSCHADGDCAAGFCVNGTCQSRLGVCTPQCC